MLYVCVGGTVAGAILSLHSFAVRAAFKSKAIDAAFELTFIPSATGRTVVRELYLGLLHLTTIGGVLAALVLFAVMLTTSLAAAQPDIP